MANLTFCRQDVEHSPFAVGNTRRNATLRNVSQSIFLRKEFLRWIRWIFYGESASYTSIYVFDTKRRTTRFKVRKALNNKFVCVFITCKVYRNWMLIKFTTSIIVRQENRSWSEGLRKPFGKIDSIHQNDSIVATGARAVATKSELLRWPNTVSARSAVLCKSQRGLQKAKQTVKCILTDLHIVCFRKKWSWRTLEQPTEEPSLMQRMHSCSKNWDWLPWEIPYRFLTTQSLEFQEIWAKNSLETTWLIYHEKSEFWRRELLILEKKIYGELRKSPMSKFY